MGALTALCGITATVSTAAPPLHRQRCLKAPLGFMDALIYCLQAAGAHRQAYHLLRSALLINPSLGHRPNGLVAAKLNDDRVSWVQLPFGSSLHWLSTVSSYDVALKDTAAGYFCTVPAGGLFLLLLQWQTSPTCCFQEPFLHCPACL